MMTPIQITHDRKSWWALKEDPFATSAIRDRKTLLIDQCLRGMPEYKDLPRGGSIIDVGAYIGYFTAMFLEDGFQVTAFEPYIDAYTCLVRNAPTARCYNSAVGDGQQVAICPEIMQDGNPGTRQCLISRGMGNHTTILDEADVPKNPCFMKIDCEGAEVHVLRGAEKILSTKPVLFIEIYPMMLDRMGTSVELLYAELRRHGYTWRDAQGASDTVRWDIIAT